jgi:hypothetical protein
MDVEEQKSSNIKVEIMLEGHKIWKKISYCFEITNERQNKVGGFFQIFAVFSQYLNFTIQVTM